MKDQLGVRTGEMLSQLKETETEVLEYGLPLGEDPSTALGRIRFGIEVIELVVGGNLNGVLREDHYRLPIAFSSSLLGVEGRSRIKIDPRFIANTVRRLKNG